MAEYNIDQIVEAVLARLAATSQGVGELRTVESLAELTSLPALTASKTEVVDAPLSLLSKPADDAAAAAMVKVAEMDEKIREATDVTSDLTTVKAETLAAKDATNEAIGKANTAAEEADAAKESVLENEELRQGNEELRMMNEGARTSAEETRAANEATRQSNENNRKTQEQGRVSAESDRVFAEDVRDAAEQSRQENTKNAIAATEAATKTAMDVSDAVKNNPPRITDGIWEVYDVLTGGYVATDSHALGKSPYISDNGTWMIYNDESGEWYDSGVSVNSDFSLTKESVESVLKGEITSHVHDSLYQKLEEGKGLSANDFTDALKQKLDGLENYDDTSLSERIENEEVRASAAEGVLQSNIDNLNESLQKEMSDVSPAHNFTELDDVEVQGGIAYGTQGWNTVSFPVDFFGTPFVACTLTEAIGTVSVRKITASGFEFTIYNLINGSLVEGSGVISYVAVYNV